MWTKEAPGTAPPLIWKQSIVALWLSRTLLLAIENQRGIITFGHDQANIHNRSRRSQPLSHHFELCLGLICIQQKAANSEVQCNTY